LQQREHVAKIANTNLKEYKQQVKEVVALDREGARTIKEPKMVPIPKGSFMMGSKTGDPDETTPVHQVAIPAFSIGVYEVTFEEFDQFAASTPGYELPNDNGWGRGKQPVIDVSWEQATAYAAWLSEKTGKRYRLATEAEWEYAARAGTTSDYYWGDGKEDPKNFAWYYQNSDGKTHPVAEKKPNDFELFDMSGNVWEWVQDCYEESYKQALRNWSAWEMQKCKQRVLRGGSWSSELVYLRSASRSRFYPDGRTKYIGFRLAKD
jgi:formylglycine-generating enzyme required for sulfatase activity